MMYFLQHEIQRCGFRVLSIFREAYTERTPNPHLDEFNPDYGLVIALERAIFIPDNKDAHAYWRHLKSLREDYSQVQELDIFRKKLSVAAEQIDTMAAHYFQERLLKWRYDWPMINYILLRYAE